RTPDATPFPYTTLFRSALSLITNFKSTGAAKVECKARRRGSPSRSSTHSPTKRLGTATMRAPSWICKGTVCFNQTDALGWGRSSDNTRRVSDQISCKFATDILVFAPRSSSDGGVTHKLSTERLWISVVWPENYETPGNLG